MEAFLGARHVVSVSSGTAGLHLAMLACDIGPGDEVVVPAMSFVAAAAAPCGTSGRRRSSPTRRARMLPGSTSTDVERLLRAEHEGGVAAHFMGYPAAVERLRTLCDEHGLLLVEDCLQAFGVDARKPGGHAGTVGDIGVFSLSSKSQLPLGEGGLVVTDDEARAARVRSLRSHAMTTVTWDRHRGHHAGYDIVGLGFNFRLDEPRAALGGEQLRRFPQRLDARRGVAEAYASRLAGQLGVELLDRHEAKGSSPFGFVVLVDDAEVRSGVRGALERQGIETMRYPLMTQLTAFAEAAPAGRPSRCDCVRRAPLRPALPPVARLGDRGVDRLRARGRGRSRLAPASDPVLPPEMCGSVRRRSRRTTLVAALRRCVTLQGDAPRRAGYRAHGAAPSGPGAPGGASHRGRGDE